MNIDKIIREEVNKFVLEQQNKKDIKSFFDKTDAEIKTYGDRASETNKNYKGQKYYQLKTDNGQTVRFYIDMPNNPAFLYRPGHIGGNVITKGEWQSIEYVYNSITNNITVTYNGQPYTLDITPAGRVTMRLTDPLESYLDWFQTALDWLGFIPGWGELIDVFNAALYFGRGNYFDGALSTLAVVPFVGSVVNVGLKTFFKANKAAASKLIRAFKTKNVTELSEVWGEAISKGYVDEKTLRTLSENLDPIANEILSRKNTLKKYTPEQYHATVDYIADYIKQLNESLGEVLERAVKSADTVKTASKVTFKASANLAKTGTRLVKFISNSSIKTMFKYIKSADDVIVNIFRKKLEKSPELVYASLKFALDALPELQRSFPAELVSKINSPDGVKLIRDMFTSNNVLYKKIVNTLMADTVLATNQYFKSFARDTITRWNGTANPVWRSTIERIRPSWMRWIDVASNEFQELKDIVNDFSEDEIDTRDEETAVLIPIVEYILYAITDDRSLLKNYFNEFYDWIDLAVTARDMKKNNQDLIDFLK